MTGHQVQSYLMLELMEIKYMMQLGLKTKILLQQSV